jgi:hypothetical protein
MEHIVGTDLHSNNGYYGIIETDGKRVFQQRLPNDLPTVLSALKPYRETIRSTEEYRPFGNRRQYAAGVDSRLEEIFATGR